MKNKKKRYGVGVRGKNGRIIYTVKQDGSLQHADHNYRGYKSIKNAQKAYDRVIMHTNSLQILEL